METEKLILHIGLPKTGTTSLQKYLFPNLKEIKYLGKIHGVNASKQFKISSIKNTRKIVVYSNEDITNPYCDFSYQLINKIIEEIKPKEVIVLFSKREVIEWARSWFYAGFEDTNDNYSDFLIKTLNRDNLFSNQVLNFNINNFSEKIIKVDKSFQLYVKDNNYVEDSISILSDILDVEINHIKNFLKMRTNSKKSKFYLKAKLIISKYKFLKITYGQLPFLIRKYLQLFGRSIKIFDFLYRESDTKKIDYLEKKLNAKFH